MAQQMCVLVREECNNYDFSPIFDCSRWFAISSLLAIFSLNFSFVGRIAKKLNIYIVKSFAMLVDVSMLQFLKLQFH
jgi:hypothetical protein